MSMWRSLASASLSLLGGAASSFGCTVGLPSTRPATPLPREQNDTALFGPTESATRAQVYAVIVAVEHYHGHARNLTLADRGAADLAARLRAAFGNDVHVMLLVDDDARRERLVRAVRAAAIRMRAPDTLFLAIDVHGDPERLMLDDGDLARVQLGRLIDAVPGNVLLALNTCGAGMYASLVAGKATRSGIFSSASDELTYGNGMLQALGNAFARRVGRDAGGGVSVRAIADDVEGSGRLQHDDVSFWGPTGVPTHRWIARVASERGTLGGALSTHDARARDCRGIDGCVRVDDALDHVLDPLDDTSRDAPTAEQPR